MRVLVIQTAFIGDVALTTPFLMGLQSWRPGVEIHVVATPQGCDMLRGLPGVRLHPLDKRTKGKLSGLKAVLNSLGRDTEFDLVFSVHRSLRSLALGRKVRARRRIAFKSFWARLFGYETVPYPPYDEAVHYADKPMRLLERVGGGRATPRPRLACEPAEHSAAREKLATVGARPGGYLVLSPFSVWGTKMWFADRFARAGAALALKTGLPIVVIGTGSGHEKVIGGTIVEKIVAAGGRAVSLVGATTIGELKAVISEAKLVLADDSAPVHIAAAFDIPTVAIFGPTVKRWGFFPLASHATVVERHDVSCRPCHLHGPRKCPRGHFRCMDLIQVEDVTTAVEDLLTGKNPK